MFKNLTNEATNPAIRSSVGDRLRWVMEVKKTKQAHLAKELGIMQSTISNIVTDSSRSPAADTLLMLCRQLACNPWWLMHGEGEPFNFMLLQESNEIELLTCWRQATKSHQETLLVVARSLASERTSPETSLKNEKIP